MARYFRITYRSITTQSMNFDVQIIAVVCVVSSICEDVRAGYELIAVGYH
jgi:hypothetical protein